MCTGRKRLTKISFPFSLYSKQLFSTDPYVKFINPFSFWRRYRINHLETCRELDTVQYLESCRKLDPQVAKLTKIGLDRDYTNTSENSLFKQAESNTIYISQPRIKLKYRGVTYYTKDTLNTDINVTKIDLGVVTSNSLRCLDNSDNVSTSKKSDSN